MQKQRTVCFLGHKPQDLGYSENTLQCDALKEQLQALLVFLIEQQGVCHFITGMEPGVEQFAAQIVLDLKPRYAQLTLECVLPFETQAEHWEEWERDIYFRIVSACDTETMLQKHESRECRQRKNVYMIEHADVVLAVWNGQPGTIGAAVAYAEEKQKSVVRMDPTTLEVSEVEYAVV